MINPFDSFDFTSPLHYWVQSSDGLTTNDYTVTVTESPVEATVIWNTGSGAWDTSSVNWLGEVFGLPAAFSDGQNVIFNKTAGGTITIAADMLPASTTVNASSGTYTFNGGPIGAGSLTKSGGGDLTLSNANTYPGGTTLRGGGVGTTANITISSYPSGTLTNNNAIDLWTTLRSHNGFNSGTGPITIHSAGLQIRNSVTLGGVISGPVGGPTLNAFDLIYGVDGGIGAGGEFKGNITLRDNQTVRIDGWGPMWSALTISGVVGDGGNGYGLNVTSNSGAARLYLTRPNTFSGDTTVAAATPNNYIGVGIGHNLALQNSTLVVNRQYTAVIGSGVTTPTIGGLKGTEALASALATASFAWADSYYSSVTALTLNLAAGKTCTYTGGIANGAPGMTLTKAGGGTQELGGANTYTGNTTVDAGQLTLTETGSLTFKVTPTSSNKLTGTGTVVLNGAFVFDRTDVLAAPAAGSWTIVDAAHVTYGATFSVSGFTKVGDVWTMSGWTFDPATGALTYAPRALITDFRYTDESGTCVGVIDQDAMTISLGPLSKLTDLRALDPTFTLSSGRCNQTSGLPPSPTFATQNPVTYTVTDGDVVNDYVVTVTVVAVPVTAGLVRFFDASQLTGYANGNPVSTWPDLSGNHADATVPSGNASPTYVANAGTEAGLPALYFPKNGGATSSGALGFTRASNIRTVFAVFKGNSFLLTDASAYHFHRPTDDNPADPLWAGYTSGNITGGSTYVNGTLVNGTSYAMPADLHHGFNLVEVITTGNVQADSFNKDRTYHAGNQYQAEVLIYDRVLSEEERLLVENYLIAKWFGSTRLTYADWAATKYAGEELSDPNADLDGDGVSNFEEYAFGLDPTTGSSVNPLTAPLDKGTHKFRYTRTEHTGLSYTVWTSADLQAWNGPAAVTETVVGTPSAGVETVEVTLTAPPAGDELFVRVQAQ
ncbi:MAG: autotransporter-associated beta strand repeat-containing protein [Verrucomicrobia bacterium]|nr:autotransporter-associated beta strand repeat-containing protein [Verrucomicrobiota bacterium]